MESCGEPILGEPSPFHKFSCSSRCPPCRMFTPMLRDAYRAARPENSEVVFVSSDRSSNEQLAYMREAHGDWPAVRAGSHLAQ